MNSYTLTRKHSTASPRADDLWFLERKPSSHKLTQRSLERPLSTRHRGPPLRAWGLRPTGVLGRWQRGFPHHIDPAHRCALRPAPAPGWLPAPVLEVRRVHPVPQFAGICGRFSCGKDPFGSGSKGLPKKVRPPSPAYSLSPISVQVISTVLGELRRSRWVPCPFSP